jgi:murein DD-endopeptidase MepM/ murein hydrolase activator NlpD
MAMRMPFMSRTQAYRQQAGFAEAILSAPATTNAGAQAQEEAIEVFKQQTVDQGQYFKQLLLQQREFDISQARAQEDFAIQRERQDYQYNLSRARAQEDFHMSRQRQEHDYQLSRSRAEHDYQLQRDRGVDDYQRSQRRAHSDFQRQRMRQERDYHHQVELMVEQSAKSMYNIYDRVSVQRTSSAGWLMFNAQDQLSRMQDQSSNLDKLRSMGISDDVIQQFDLGNAANAQQLARMVTDLQNNPEMVQQFNKVVRKRLEAAAELVKDESSKEWEEFQRQYNLARRRAANDFERQVNRSHRDFDRQMERMETDFRRSMNRQADDYETAQDRQQEDFSKSMRRAAADYATSVDNMTDDFAKSMRRARNDLNRMSKEISGDLESILEKSTNKLGGIAGKQAETVLKTLRGLNVDASEQGIKMMLNMADVFGFKYKVPKLDYGFGVGGQSTTDDTPRGMGAAGGAVLPGRSIGKDNLHFFSPQFGTLNLAGGEAIMVPEWVEAVGGPAKVMEMNKAARYKRSFAEGGVTPAPGTWTRHETGYPWARWSGDINVPGTGDFGNAVKAWKSGRVAFAGWGGADSYGNYIKINHPESEESTLYAHLSRIAVSIGDLVKGGDKIGNVGSTGNSSGPHLHFEIIGGTGPIMYGSPGAGVSGDIEMRSLLQERYPAVEKAARKVRLGGGLFKDGWWSKRLNDYARDAVSERTGGDYGHGSIFDGPSNIRVGERGPEAVIPLDDRGLDFVTGLIARTSTGLDGRRSNVSGYATPTGMTNNYNYQIDRSTNFTGDITVRANDPNQFLSELRRRERAKALVQPAIGGRRI